MKAVRDLLTEALHYTMDPSARSHVVHALALLSPKDQFRFTDAATGVPWLCVIVRPGTPYGAITPEGPRACIDLSHTLVEFWDCRHPFDAEHKAQFVTRYILETLMDRAMPQGLCLDGGWNDWTLCAQSMSGVYKFLLEHT